MRTLAVHQKKFDPQTRGFVAPTPQIHNPQPNVPSHAQSQAPSVRQQDCPTRGESRNEEEVVPNKKVVPLERRARSSTAALARPRFFRRRPRRRRLLHALRFPLLRCKAVLRRHGLPERPRPPEALPWGPGEKREARRHGSCSPRGLNGSQGPSAERRRRAHRPASVAQHRLRGRPSPPLRRLCRDATRGDPM